MGRNLIFWRYFSPIIFSIIVLVTITVVYLPKYMIQVATEQAIVESQQLASQLRELRNYYSKHVVDKVVSQTDIKTGTNYLGVTDTIPLPATMIHDLSQRYSNQNYTVKLYSEYPFSNRESRKLDTFELQAWQNVKNSPDAVFNQVTQVNDVRYLRVAIADVMSNNACVSCHNLHPDSPKRDWRIGDVRGVLEVTRNLEPIINHGKSISFNIVLLSLMLLFVVAVVFILVAQKIYSSVEKQASLNKKLSITVKELAQANQQIQNTTEQLIKSERIALLDNLVVGVSHELSTPLGISVTASSTLSEEISLLEQEYQSKNLSSKKLERFIEQSKTSSHLLDNNMDKVARLLASFKHIVVDETENTKKLINFHQFLEDIILTLSASFNGESFNLKLSSQGEWSIKTCSSYWTQVITILTNNALEHAFEAQQFGNITINAEYHSQNLVFTFADDGSGMTKETENKIFQPFFTTKRGEGGTGLGLHVLTNIVELKLNGKVSCHSVLGQGTRFIITIPVMK